jgi:hypothetical protein
MKIKIYGLINPETSNILYVGKTSLSLKRRLQLHITKAAQNKTRKDKWILELIKISRTPEIILLEEPDRLFANKKEKEWILKFGLSNLVNGNSGGGGNNGSGAKRNEAYKQSLYAFLMSSKYSKNTISNSICYVNNFINYFKNEVKSPKEINGEQIKKYIETINNINTRNANIVALKLFYKNVMNQPYKLKKINYEYPRTSTKLHSGNEA